MNTDPSRIEAELNQVSSAVQRYVHAGLSHPETIQQEIKDLLDQIAQRRESLEDDLRSTQTALAECEAQFDIDADGNIHRPDCSFYYEQLREIRSNLAKIARLPDLVDRAERRFGSAGQSYQHTMNQVGRSAVTWLAERITSLQQFNAVSSSDLPEESAVRLNLPPPTFSTIIQTVKTKQAGSEGHGTLYNKSRQTFLRSLVDNPDQPHYVRGWLRQELNRMDRIANARRLGSNPPGGNPYRLRGVPGLDVGHIIAGWDHPSNFRLELTSMNRARPSIAKRLKLSPEYY